MRTFHFIFYFPLILFYCQAQTSLKQTTISSSAVNANGESVVLSVTVGQVFVGEQQSDNSILSAGLWGKQS